MKKLLNEIEKLKQSEIKYDIEMRMKQFQDIGCKSSEELFKELCFCLLTANFHAERAIHIQDKIGNGFLTLSKSELAKKLKQLGYRFPNKRAEYIAKAQEYKNSLKNIINSHDTEHSLRNWLVENVKGLGYKEASHFLRNIGHTNYALVDFHIIDLLVRHKIIKRPKTITPKVYLQIENKLADIAKKTNLNQAQLDLYLWYMETGKVLK